MQTARMWQVVSSLLAGAAIGSLSGSTLADSLGRKIAFAANAAPLLAGALLSATATSLVPMVAGRAIAGFGIGLASALVPLYISEVHPILSGALRCKACLLLSAACSCHAWKQKGTYLPAWSRAACSLEYLQTFSSTSAYFYHCLLMRVHRS